MADEKVTMSLGKRLRGITDNAKAEIETAKFIETLEGVAAKGIDRVQFKDLREHIPTLISSGKVFDWMAQNELSMNGSVNSETAKWEYTISW